VRQELRKQGIFRLAKFRYIQQKWLVRCAAFRLLTMLLTEAGCHASFKSELQCSSAYVTCCSNAQPEGMWIQLKQLVAEVSIMSHDVRPAVHVLLARMRQGPSVRFLPTGAQALFGTLHAVHSCAPSILRT
jgi:hypothetical protein